MTHRRHDIDALRVLAFALVIAYHVGMYYVAGWHWHLKSPHAAEWLRWPMRALNLWRMDLVFLVSGIALSLLWRGGSRRALLRVRTTRLLVPLVFGMAAVVPYQAYLQAVAQGAASPGLAAFLARYFTGGPWPAGAFDGSDFGVTWNHLWFLPYLWLYTALFVLAAPLLVSPAGLRLRAAFTGLRGWRWALPVLPLMAWSILLWSAFPAKHDLVHDAWLHAVYATLVLYGWWLGTDAGAWAELRRLRWATLSAAAVLLGLHFAAPAGLPARLAGDAYLWAAILAVLGWAHHALNRPWPWLGWANESVYPWYVLHQTWILALAAWLAPAGLGPVLEPLALLAGTVAGCWVLTAAIRRTGWLRPLFGLRPRARPRCPSPATPARPAGRSA